MIRNDRKDARQAFATEVLQAMQALQASRVWRKDAKDELMVLLFSNSLFVESVGRWLGSLLPLTADVEDVLEGCFEKVARAIKKKSFPQSPDGVLPWLKTQCKRVGIDLYRKEEVRGPARKRRMLPSESQTEDQDESARNIESRPEEIDGDRLISHHPADPEERAAGREKIRAYLACVEELPDRQQEAWLLRRHEELTGKQAAKKMGITENTIGVLVHRAYTRLVGCMESKGFPVPGRKSS